MEAALKHPQKLLFLKKVLVFQSKPLRARMQRGSIKTIRVSVVYVDKTFTSHRKLAEQQYSLSRNTSQQYSETLEYLLTLIMTKIILYGSPSKKI
jgi:hypothetical protein